MNRRIEFSAEADGASRGAYKILEYAGGGEYQESKIGVYSWNETTQRITLKPEKVAARLRGFSIDYGSLENKTAYRTSLQAMLNNAKEQTEGEINQIYINQIFSLWGFSSDDAYLDYMTAEEFANKTYNYDFSVDGTELFLDQVLPANKGSNELDGQTYNGLDWDTNEDITIKDPNDIYTFTGYAYTHTDAEYPLNNSSGTYVYDGDRKWVWMRFLTAASSTSYKVEKYRYNTTDKTIIFIP